VIERNVEQFAELLGCPVVALAEFLRIHWPPGESFRAAERLQLYRIPPPIIVTKTKPEIYRERVRHLVENGLVPSTTRGIYVVAEQFGLEYQTVHDAVYRPRRPRRQRRAPPGAPLVQR